MQRDISTITSYVIHYNFTKKSTKNITLYKLIRNVEYLLLS